MEQYQQEHLLCLASSVENMVRHPDSVSSAEVKAVDEQLHTLMSDTPSELTCTLTPLAMGGSPSTSNGNEELKKPALHRTRSLALYGEKGLAGESSDEHSPEAVLQLRQQVANQQQHILELRSKVEHLQNSFQDTRSQLRDMMMDIQHRSCQGSFLWRLKNYKKLRAEALSGSPNCVIHSPGFYTSFNGYQFCIRLNLNGVENAQGTHLSLFIHLMRSDNDDVLPWPFTGKVTLSVCDQHQQASKRNPISETLVAKPGLAAFQRPTTFRNHKGFGYMEFAPLSYIESEERCFIKDDMLLIKAEVRPNVIL